MGSVPIGRDQGWELYLSAAIQEGSSPEDDAQIFTQVLTGPNSLLVQHPKLCLFKARLRYCKILVLKD